MKRLSIPLEIAAQERRCRFDKIAIYALALFGGIGAGLLYLGLLIHFAT